MAQMRKPRALKPGDTVAVVSPSWGGPSVYPHIFDQGLAVLQGWGLRIREYPTARMPADVLYRHPEQRAADINHAFGDESVRAVFASIGGDDSLRILPYIDEALIRRNPKILLGFSDTTTLLSAFNQLGMITLYGPSVMAGIAQLPFLPAAHRQHVHQMLFAPSDTLVYRAASHYSDGYQPWEERSRPNRPAPPQLSRGWQFLQGTGVVRGQLYGGCIEVLEWLKGSRYWPAADFWRNKILFLETSEEKPPISEIARWLRSYGLQGIFAQISALLVGRPYGFSLTEQLTLDNEILKVVRDEWGAKQLPIVTHFDIGHTEPQVILPLGAHLQIDCDQQQISLVEPWLLPA